MQARRDDLYTAGTRLKVRSLVAGDGARMQAGFWDSARNEACAFVTASDEKTRCLPVLGGGAGQIATQFVDAQCTSAAFVSSGACAPSYGYVYSVETTCSGSSARYELHTLAEGAISTIYALSGTTCAQAQPLAGYSYFRSTGVVDPSSFVEASYVIEP